MEKKAPSPTVTGNTLFDAMMKLMSSQLAQPAVNTDTEAVKLVQQLDVLARRMGQARESYEAILQVYISLTKLDVKRAQPLRQEVHDKLDVLLDIGDEVSAKLRQLQAYAIRA